MRPLSSPSPASSPVRRVLGRAATAVLLVATVAGCGDDPSSDAGQEPSASSSSSATDSPSASESTSESASPSASPSAGESPSDTAPAGPTLEVQVTGDEVTPVAQEVDLAVGERLTIDVQSDRAGELHVHSDPEHSFDFDSGRSQFQLRLDTPGSVDIEEHVADALVARVLVR